MDVRQQLAATPRANPTLFEEGGIVATRALADALAILAGWAASYHLYIWLLTADLWQRKLPRPTPYIGMALSFTIICLLVFWQLGLYRRRATVLNLREFATAVKGVVLSGAYFVALLFLLRFFGYSRLVVIGAMVISTLLIIIERRLLSSFIGRLQRSGRLGRKVLIYGCGSTGRLLMKKIVQAPQLGCTVVGFLDDTVPIGTSVACRITQTGPILFQAPVLGRWKDLQEVVTTHGINELLVTAPSVNPERLRSLFQLCRSQGLKLGVIPHLQDLRADQLQVEDLSAIPILRPFSASSRRIYLVLKRLFDLAVAPIILLITAPIWIIAAIAIPLDSAGPVFFVQERVGLYGRRFRMFKFRTMRRDASPYAASPVGDVDPRITRVGRILRMGGLDELPQLLNVLRGDMSLVGPRPEMPFIVDRYSPLERQRLNAKPGLTGVWQLSADRHAEIHENIEYDLYYLNHQSLVIDMLILLETLFFTFGLILRAPKRRSLADQKPAVITPEDAGSDEAYLIVALDQRRNGVQHDSWQAVLPAAYSVADRWPVKILVARENVATFDRLLDGPIRRLGTQNYRSEYVVYRDRDELRTLIKGARLVITDLSHIEAWAKETGRDVLSVDEDGIRRSPGTQPADEIVNALDEVLPPTHRLEKAGALDSASSLHLSK